MATSMCTTPTATAWRPCRPAAGSRKEYSSHGSFPTSIRPGIGYLNAQFDRPQLLATVTGLRVPTTLDSRSSDRALLTAVHKATSATGTHFKHMPQRRGTIVAIFERFTERAIKAVLNAQREAKAMGKTEVGTIQLLLGLVAEEKGSEGFLRTGVTLERARDVLRLLGDESGSQASGGDKPPTEIPFAQGSKRVFETALDESRRLSHNYIAPEHIAVALLRLEDGPACKALDKLGLRTEKLLAEALARLEGEAEFTRDSPSLQLPNRLQTAAAGKSARSATSSGSGSRKEKSVLQEFCVDITARAAEGKVDPVIGREREVERVIQILARRTKNNPILLGEPGVGKTAIAEGLAMRIIGKKVPEFLKTKRVMSLDMGLLLAGAKERGELETRVTSLVAETRSAGDVILLIDEVHTLVGSGSVGRGGGSGTGLDIANLLKPALARGELQCIGATTLDEHRKHIEKDKALARRFQPIMVEEPSEEDALAILMGLKSRYEEHHRCTFTAQAIESAVLLSARYISDRYLPDKAIDLIDEAGSRARINAFRAQKKRTTSILQRAPEDIWTEIRAVQAAQEKREADREASRPNPVATMSSAFSSFLGGVAVGGTASSTPLSRLGSMEDDMSTLTEAALRLVDEFGDVEVGPEQIAEVASAWSGVPVQQLSQDEAMRLINLERSLKERVIGQDLAVNAVARAVRRARVGLKDPNRPIATMLLSGPTGVGKTELTKALAHQYFGAEDAMVRLDMSEYMERHTVSKLIGSPPGYVGYGDGGVLTEAVRRRPFTVVLLDEIEKAHPDVFNILLQMFEDGRLTDSQGRTVSFKNTLIIMTSNIGSQVIARGGGHQFGFALPTGEADGGAYSRLKSVVLDELKNYFRPELLNRLDEVVVFAALEKGHVRSIVDLMLNEVKSRVQKNRVVSLELTEAMIQHVCDEGYDPVYGARPLRRAITRLVEDPLSEALLSGAVQPGETALLDFDSEAGVPAVTACSIANPPSEYTAEPQPVSTAAVYAE